jgi:hypothetical protein
MYACYFSYKDKRVYQEKQIIGRYFEKLAEIFGGFENCSYLCTRKRETMVP